MSAMILDGKVLAERLKTALAHKISQVGPNGTIRIACFHVGEDPGGLAYAFSQEKTARSVGIGYELKRFPASISFVDLKREIERCNLDSRVHGIIINKPLPKHIPFDDIINSVVPLKDIEGMTLANLGRLFLGQAKVLPCTAAAAMALLKECHVPLAGKEAVVIGRSQIVGKPLSLLLLAEHVTTTICHSATSKAGLLDGHLKRADIIFAAIGQPLFVKAEWVKPGAIVIDVGINSVNNRIVGDVDFEQVKERAGFISPVPGGVGPVTAVMLMQNTLEAYVCQH